MPTSPKPTAPAARKRAPKKDAEVGTQPFLRFHHPQALRVKTIEVLEAVEGAEKATTSASSDWLGSANGTAQHRLQADSAEG